MSDEIKDDNARDTDQPGEPVVDRRGMFSGARSAPLRRQRRLRWA